LPLLEPVLSDVKSLTLGLEDASADAAIKATPPIAVSNPLAVKVKYEPDAEVES